MTAYETFFILTNWISLYSIHKLFNLFFGDCKCNIKLKNMLFALYFIGFSLIILVTRVPIIMSIFNISIIFAISFSYKSTFKKKLLSCSFMYAIMIVIEILTSVAFGFWDLHGLKETTFASIPQLIFLRVFTLVIVHLMCRYVVSYKKDNALPSIYGWAFFIILFGSLYLFIAQLNTDNINPTMLFISGSILILINITMIVMDEKIYNVIQLENERNLFKERLTTLFKTH